MYYTYDRKWNLKLLDDNNNKKALRTGQTIDELASERTDWKDVAETVGAQRSTRCERAILYYMRGLLLIQQHSVVERWPINASDLHVLTSVRGIFH